jgi:hypothetical protein
MNVTLFGNRVFADVNELLGETLIQKDDVPVRRGE